MRKRGIKIELIGELSMIKLKTVVLETNDIAALCSFYSELLQWPIVFQVDTFIRIQSPQNGTGIAFQFDEDYIPPMWSTESGKQQMMAHLDFGVADKSEMKNAVEKAIRLGAKIADTQCGNEEWITMFDPAGHPFCFVIWN